MSSVDRLVVTANFKSGIQDGIDLTATTNTHTDVNFTPGSDLDIKNLVLDSVIGVEEPLTVEFVEACVPDYPFYVRWVNRLGGWEYHMFSANKRKGAEVKETDSFTPYSGTLTGANRTRETLSIERTDVVEVGEEQLNPDTFALLASIALSPRIDVYNTVLQRWEGITVNDKHTAMWDTRTSQGVVGYTFRLIDQNNQF